MTRYRRWNTNERVTSQGLNQSQDATLWSAAELTGMGQRLARAGIDGAVISGCNWTYTSSTVTVAAGIIILASLSTVQRNWSTYLLPTDTYTPVLPPAGDLRIDTIYAEASGDTFAVPGSTFVRDPITGVVTPSTLNTQATRTAEILVVAGTEVTAAGYTPGTGNGAYTDVLVAPSHPVRSVPIAYVYVDSSGIVAVVDARPLMLPKNWTTPATGYVSFSLQGATVGGEEVAGSNPSAWRWYGTKPSGGAGIGATIPLRIGIIDETTNPAAYRFVTPEGVMLSVPPGLEATTIGAVDTRVALDSGFNATIAVDHTVTDAVIVARYDAGGGGTNPPFRNIQRGYLSAARAGITAAMLPARRLTPFMLPQDYGAATVDVEIYLVDDGGQSLSLTPDVLDGGVMLRVRWWNRTPQLVTPQATITMTPSVNCTAGPLSAGIAVGGMAYVLVDAGSASCTVQFEALPTTTDFEVVVEAEVVANPQFDFADPVYTEGWDIRINGHWRYAPGGAGTCLVLLA